MTEIVWSAELGAELLSKDDWPTLLTATAEDPEIFSAYLRTIKWNTAIAADRKLMPGPFRAGIRLNAYQLTPLRKALRLPRVNLPITDDVGPGMTVEAERGFGANPWELSSRFIISHNLFVDSQFTRDVKVRPGHLDPVMVRRLKADLRHFSELLPNVSSRRS